MELLVHPATGLRYRKGSQDLFMIRELRSYLDLEPTSSDVILDVGACFGSITSWARSLGSKVIAVEPHPVNFELLSLNAPHDTDNLRAACVADYRSEVILYVNRGSNGGLHSTTPHRGREEIIVPTVKFSKLLRDHRVNKIKMDCEGAEYELLLAKLPNRVTHLAVEIHLTKKDWRSNGPRLHDWLLAQGFIALRQPRFDNRAWATFGTYRRD